mgnify:CR=1 FL=1
MDNSWSTIHCLCLQSRIKRKQKAQLAYCECAVNMLSPARNSPLHFVALSGNIEMAWFLISHGADFVTNDYDETALHWACKSGNHTMVDLFLSQGADINAGDMDGNTPIHWATENNHFELVALLLKREDCYFDCKNYCGFTPLEVACMDDSAEVAEILINAGACTNRLIRIAVEYDCPNVAKLLKSLGLTLTEIDPTIFKLAMVNKSTSIFATIFSSDPPELKRISNNTTPHNRSPCKNVH